MSVKKKYSTDSLLKIMNDGNYKRVHCSRRYKIHKLQTFPKVILNGEKKLLNSDWGIQSLEGLWYSTYPSYPYCEGKYSYGLKLKKSVFTTVHNPDPNKILLIKTKKDYNILNNYRIGYIYKNFAGIEDRTHLDYSGYSGKKVNTWGVIFNVNVLKEFSLIGRKKTLYGIWKKINEPINLTKGN